MLDQDQLTRASLIIGIHRALRILNSKAYADAWPTLDDQHPLLAGRTSVYAMSRSGIPGRARDSATPRWLARGEVKAFSLPLIEIDLEDTHRLIPSVWDEPVVNDATGPRLHSARDLPANFLLPDNELPHAHIVNGASEHGSAAQQESPYLDPVDYRTAEALAEDLRAPGSLGIRYPSVRERGGRNLVLV